MLKQPISPMAKFKKPDDPDQSKRFKELAAELGADCDDGLDASIQRLGKQTPEPRRKVGKKAKIRKA